MTTIGKMHAVADPAAVSSDRDAWIARGKCLSESGSERQWEFADWAFEGMGAFGSETVREISSRLGISSGFLSTCIVISKAYPLFRRRNTLGFSQTKLRRWPAR